MGQPQLSPRSPDPWKGSFMLTDQDLPPLLSAFLVESLLYGMHVVLFIICLRVLLRRRRRMQMMMLAAVIVMFILATADIAISWNIVLRHTQWLYASDSNTFYRAIYPKYLIHLVNNVIADVLLIIRCCVVWGNRKYILYGFVFFLTGATVLGIIGEGTTAPSLKKFLGIYLVSVLILNLTVTILTAGRILWIAREVRSIMGTKIVSYYHFASGALIESGTVYTASTILVFILTPTNYLLTAVAILIRAVGIMPILLIVEIALGQTTKDVNSTVSVLRAGTHHQTIVLDTIVSSNQVDYEGENERQLALGEADIHRSLQQKEWNGATQDVSP